MKTQHFPWERLITCLLANLAILAIGFVYKDWLWDFAVLDPHATSGAVAITALSAFAGVMITVIGAIQIFFITGSTRSLEAMFKFGSMNQAAEVVESETTRNDSVEEIDQKYQTQELKSRYGDR
jgi:hypothetical protein